MRLPNTCDRCGSSLKGQVMRMSFFNTDMCCLPCIEKERQHPDYQKAKEVERQAVLEGNYNFPGIGKPADL